MLDRVRTLLSFGASSPPSQPIEVRVDCMYIDIISYMVIFSLRKMSQMKKNPKKKSENNGIDQLNLFFH